MQYQVFNKETDEIVAWIDTETNKCVVQKGYDIKVGEKLTAVEVEEE